MKQENVWLNSWAITGNFFADVQTNLSIILFGIFI